MLEITILLMDTTSCDCFSFFCVCSPHNDTHIKARVHDRETDRCFYIDYPYRGGPPYLYYSYEVKSYDRLLDIHEADTARFYYNFYSEVRRAQKKVVLAYEGEKTLEAFADDYRKNFRNKPLSKLSHNCSDAILYMVNYFFRAEFQASAEIATFDLYQKLCCLTSVLTLGCFSCLPAPPCITTPNDLFIQLEFLAASMAETPARKEEIAHRSLEAVAGFWLEDDTGAAREALEDHRNFQEGAKSDEKSALLPN